MKKAFEQLDSMNICYTFHDYKKQGIDSDTLQTWLQQADKNIILNKRGTTWRKLSDEQQSFALSNEAALIETLKEHTSLIKRPVLETPDGLLVGFDLVQYKQLKKPD